MSLSNQHPMTTVGPSAGGQNSTESCAVTGPLQGLIVLDLTRALADPHATMMLADQGARVIKIEAPESGDDSRGWGPPFVLGNDGKRYSTYFLSCNRNKESVTLDLKSTSGVATLTRLIQRADVLVENFRTGVLDRLGFSIRRLRDINPALVVLSITGFGHDGPDASRSGYDQIVQGEGGLMSLTGPSPDQPTKIGVPISDLLAGMYGAFGVLCALQERARTGRGSVVRTSLLAAVVGAHAYHGTCYTVAGQIPGTGGTHHPSICPYGLFHTADGMVQVAVGSDLQWRAFAAEFGIARPEWATNALRVADRNAVIAAVDTEFAALDRLSVMTKLRSIGVPAGLVRTLDEVYEWEQTRSQGLLVNVEHPALGRITLPGPPLRFDDGGRTTHTAPPTLGQDNEAVLAWLDGLER